jgi:hypothetical protein
VADPDGEASGGATTTDSAGDWATPAERDGYRTTPDYAETMAYLERLTAAHPDRLRLERFGSTGEGRDLWIAIASRDGVFDPNEIHASGRAILLVQNSIHAGEMDGKDACLGLLRDLLTDPKLAHRLDHVVLVVIPIYNADGHERRSPYGRINQNGPATFGWRANGTNLNLNRDYMKADAPETRAFLRLFHRWLPDFFVDDHVTDGADFQYDVTFVLDDTANVAPATAQWIRSRVTPELVRGVDATGHLAFPYGVFLRDDTDPAQGLLHQENPPRFSTGRTILEGRPGLLVELHMLKDYRTRVTGNRAILDALLELLDREAAALIALNRAADQAAGQLGSCAARGEEFPLEIVRSGETAPVAFRGVRYSRSRSEVSGAMRLQYENAPWETTLTLETTKVGSTVVPPAGYIVPPAWTRVIDVLEAQGVAFRRTGAGWTGAVGRYRLGGMQWLQRPFEGRHPILRGGPVEADMGRFGECTLTVESATFGAGSAVVPLDQRLSRVAIHWLEPSAPDSAVRWGFFDSIFEQKETGEAYVLERLARDALAKDPALRAEFERRVAEDAAFAASPQRRLEFFFDRSPWGAANRVGEYPVGRLPTLEGLPLGG